MRLNSYSLTLLFALLPSLVLFAQEKEAHESPDTLRFSLLRQNDRVVISPREQLSLYKKAKQFSLGKKATLSLGGSVRLQAEAFLNEQFDNRILAQDDLWFLNRNMLYAHLKSGKSLEVFGELSTANIFGKPELTPVDKDLLAVNQLFVLLKPTSALQFLFGRQNIRFGSSRLVDVREGPNVRLSFDMAEAIFQKNNFTARALFAVPVRSKEEIFDNETLNFQEYFYTLYFTLKKKKLGTDIYGIYKYEENKIWNAGTGNDSRFSVGTRLFGMLGENFRFNNEFVFQTGDFSGQHIQAWTASVQLMQEVKFGNTPFTFSVKSELISGDRNSEDNHLNTFDALYPRGAYFGRVARFGPSNLFDVHPAVEAQVGKLFLSADYVAFWRFSTNDGLYNPALILEYPSVNSERFIGHQVGMISGFEVNSFFGLEVEANIIFPGNFLVYSALKDNLFHAVLTAEFEF